MLTVPKKLFGLLFFTHPRRTGIVLRLTGIPSNAQAPLVPRYARHQPQLKSNGLAKISIRSKTARGIFSEGR